MKQKTQMQHFGRPKSAVMKKGCSPSEGSLSNNLV
jgi:hypothetical protein